ncbi:MAG: hypothetical protein BWX66_01905 [Deltaproteobacteria bacterium ADurb.Bin058]|nr:MAG: hypothetical protein BWX66_01905 [Deltaproteobacteria bacterium ADurb.Bin058]
MALISRPAHSAGERFITLASTKGRAHPKSPNSGLFGRSIITGP